MTEVATTAGGRLRAAREAAGLSVDAVAQQLKLAPRQVTALEEDDWQGLPGRTFIRGFARNYARFVRLDPEAVLALLPAPETAPALERPALRTSTRPMGEIPAEREPKSSAWRWLVPLAIVAIIAAVAYVELSRTSLHLPSGLTLPGVTTPRDAKPTAAAPAAPAESATPAPASAAPAATSTLALTPRVVDGAPAVADAQPPAAGAPGTANVPTAETPATPPAASAGATASSTTAAAAAAGDAPLLLEFHGTSWAEVKDANGRVVLQMTGGPGMTQSVNAAPPLELALGNAPAVGVTFRGQPLDLAPYTRGNVARVGLK